MRIVRPYGTSRSRRTDERLRRFLIDNTPERQEHDIPEFARSHDELVIGQWISTIDKIARKPAGKNKPSPAQYALRTKLGNACWVRLIDGGHLPGAKSGRGKHLSDVWWFKIHPYGTETKEPRRNKDGSLPVSAEVKGRSYALFAGDGEPENADAVKIGTIAKRIEKHLYDNERRTGANAKPKQKGRIGARAESIEGNVLRMPEAPDARPNRPTWREEDIEAYTELGDPAAMIRQRAEALEEDGERMSLPETAKVLFAHWGKVFRDPETSATMGVKEAMEKLPGRFAVHDALKQCYRRLLKRTRKDTSAQRKESERRGEKERPLSILLPRDLEDALELSGLHAKNAELAELVRFGKIIHYEASRTADRQPPADGQAEPEPRDDIEGPMADRPAAVATHWPDNVAESPFWQSDGQAEIKRAEAFVRVWRHVLVLAGLTLKDWVSMRVPFDGDILGGMRQRDDALKPERFERGRFERKLSVLLGARAKLMRVDTDADCLALLHDLIDGARSLRHAVFHFKGRGHFLNELSTLHDNLAGPINEDAKCLWDSDVKDRTKRLKHVLIAAHVQEFLTQEQVNQAFQLIAGEAVTELPLPRFSRVLERRKNAWEDTIRLPEPANLRALEVPKRLCQYTVLKLLYERPFRSWLKSQRGEAISACIDRAVARATVAAKALNATDEAGREVITARAADMPKLSGKRDIMDFFFDLSAATASEMRVQSGYQSDREQAHEQARYIDDLLCDVVVLSFSQYLSVRQLDWLLDLKDDPEPLKQPICSLDNLQMPEPRPELVAEDWQAALYLIVHLLPVEAVGQLLHQLFKWNTAATRETSLRPDEDERRKRLEATLSLYLDMHDAKFEGGYALAGCEEFGDLFGSKHGFEKLSAQASREEPDRRVPQRGLREIARFGHLPLVKSLCRGKTIDDAMIACVSAMEDAPNGGESPIALLHKTREGLHDKWVEEKRLDANELSAYCDAIAKISEHRRQSNFVNLVDHVRAHRMVLSVLGRLVDYAGLFERDLYFVTLALLYRRGLRPGDLLNREGQKDLSNGQIISALGNYKKDSIKTGGILKELAEHFAEVWERDNRFRRIRNSLAHLEMLQGDAPQPWLTRWANQTRRLMNYDRKMKNAVSKSVIDLLEREGLTLRWTINTAGDAHDLGSAKLSSRCAEHLGSKRLTLKGAAPKDKGELINERLHGEDYVAMIAAAFEGEPVPTISILDDLSRVDWEASVAAKRPRRDRERSGPRRPESGRDKYRPGSRGRELRN